MRRFLPLLLLIAACEPMEGEDLTLEESEADVTVVQRWNFDLGNTTSTTLGYVNVSPSVSGGGSLTALHDAAGSSTGVGLRITEGFSAGNANSNGTTSPASTTGFPATATQDSFFGNTVSFSGQVRPHATVELTGLDPAASYNLTLFASRMGVTDDRSTAYTIGTTTKVLNAANNTSSVVVFSALRPSSTGVITLGVGKGSTNNNPYGFFYLGAMRLERVVASTPYGTQTAVRRDTTRFGTDKPPNGYYEYLPYSYAASTTQKWPVILFYEGIGQRGNGTDELYKMLQTGLPQVISGGKFPAHDKFIVLSVQYSSYASPSTITAFLTWAKRHYRIDTTHMYLTGLSYGAFATWDYGNTMGDNGEFAALVPISGNDGAKTGSQFRHTPVWIFHGEDDANEPTYVEKSIASYNRIVAAGPAERPRLTIFPGTGHSASTWNRVYDLTRMNTATDATYDPFDRSVYDWMLLHHR